MALNTTINSGQVGFSTPGAVIDSTIPSRRLFDFSDRVADLAPEESPFFVYLSKVGKVPTSDSQFRFLEDRTKIEMTDRSFRLEAAVTLVAPGSNDTLTFHNTAADDGVDYLIPGMVVAIGDIDGNSVPTTATVRINTVDNTTSTTVTTCSVTCISTPGASTLALTDESKCTIIGTSFKEGSGAPDVWSSELDNAYGYTQIFKTACEMSNTARATVYRGYSDEWARLWNLKLREHKIDIERAMLFGQQGSAGGIQYTDGIVGSTIYNGYANIVNDGSQVAYNEGKPYYKSNAITEWTYDDLLSDFEVIFDPARGGGSSKLALCSLPVISYFNKFASNASLVGSIAGTASEDNPFRYNFSQSNGSFGHKIMKVDTIHGDLSLIKEPLFRGFASGFCMMVDLDHVTYRPLVGNGVNRDTSITTNVQQADEDLRKDMILTEAGLEVSLPETHALINLEGV